MVEMKSVFSRDSGGRRSGMERRQFTYLIHIPERRSGEDRRGGIDRRAGIGMIRSRKMENRAIFKNQHR